MQRINSIYFAESSLGGRGVFTAEDIPEGAVIEICPVIVLSASDRKTIHDTSLHDYYFIWGENDDEAALILGFGSLYNHSYSPNAEYAPNFEAATLTVFATKTIAAGDEILVNYSGTPDERMEVWFDIKE